MANKINHAGLKYGMKIIISKVKVIQFARIIDNEIKVNIDGQEVKNGKRILLSSCMDK